MGDYNKALQIDEKEASHYYKASIKRKSEQQKFLEELIAHEEIFPNQVADIACGGGAVSLHLSRLFPNAQFNMLDFNENALDTCRKIMSDKNTNIFKGNKCL